MFFGHLFLKFQKNRSQKLVDSNCTILGQNCQKLEQKQGQIWILH